MSTRRPFGHIVLSAVAAVGLIGLANAAPDEPTLPESWTSDLDWRSIGPANMSGRITALAVYEADPVIWYAATASGGLLKTVNDGTTFEHQFDKEATVSIGDVAVSKTDPDLVWVGTGESNPRNSVSWGNGVYKSTDGGDTWEHMGLADSFQIGRVVIHPEDHDTVYVGALGRLWGPNEERGLYKTTDGGATWERVLYVDDKTGVIDVAMHPTDPDTLLAATYERERDGFDTNDPSKRFGPGAGLWRTTDGGANWERMTEGLPTNDLGRIGLDWYRADPNVVYMVLESSLIGQEPENAPYHGASTQDAEVGARVTGVADESPAAEAGLQEGDIVLRLDDEAILSNEQFTYQVRQRVAGNSVTLEIARNRERVSVELTFTMRPGLEESEDDEEQPRRRQGRNPFTGTLGGQAANMQDHQGPDGHEHGGVYRSADGGVSWERINSLNPRPMYYSRVRVDPQDENYLYILGTSLWKSDDRGETFSGNGHRGRNGSVHVDHHAMWIDPDDGRHMILGNDGGVYITRERMLTWDHLNHVAIGQFYHVGVAHDRDYMVYGGLQDNGSWGGPSRSRSGRGPVNEDWISVGGGDGFICLVDPEDPDQIYFESQNGGMGRINLRTGERGFIRPQAPRGTRYRFNWKTPFLLSHHNSKIYYAAGNHVFRSLNKGSGMKVISPEITNGDRGAASALTESPLDEDVLYVGTDDGALWMTSDGGAEWVNLFDVEAEPAAAPREDGGGRGARGGGPGGRGGARGEGRGGGGRGERRGGFDAERMRERIPQLIEQMDANGDGAVTADEMPERMAGLLDRIDTNGDGKLTSADAAARSAEGESEAEGQDEGDAAEAPSGPAGTWSGTLEREGASDEERAFSVIITGSGDTLAATVNAKVVSGDADKATFDDGTLRLEFEAQGGPIVLEATIEGNEMSGKLTMGGGLLSVPVKASRQDDRRRRTGERRGRPQEAGEGEGDAESDASEGDPIAGTWSAEGTSEAMGGDSFDFTIEFERNAEGKITGAVRSQFNDSTVSSVSYDADSGKLVFVAASDDFEINYDAKVSGETMTGSGDVGGGMFSFEFTAARTSAPAAQESGDGHDWKSIGDLVPGPRRVSSLETSRYEAGRVYMTLDGHRHDDDAAYVFVSENFGRTWRSLTATLPEGCGSTRVVREDIANPRVLYLGTEFGIWVSIDRGDSWTKMHGEDFPTVAVHEIAQHRSSGEIVAGTHGRSLWILDVSALRQMGGRNLSETHLYRPTPAVHWKSDRSRGGTLRRFVGENPSSGAQIWYSLPSDARSISLVIKDASGATIRELDASGSAGLHRVTWDLRRTGQQQQQRGGRRGGGRGALAASGTYSAVLTVDGDEHTTSVRVEGDPMHPDYRPWATQFMDMAWEAAFGEEESEDQ